MCDIFHYKMLLGSKSSTFLKKAIWTPHPLPELSTDEYDFHNRCFFGFHSAGWEKRVHLVLSFTKWDECLLQTKPLVSYKILYLVLFLSLENLCIISIMVWSISIWQNENLPNNRAPGSPAFDCSCFRERPSGYGKTSHCEFTKSNKKIKAKNYAAG